MSANPVALPAPPHATEQQRLTATLVLSALVHGLLILGVGFAVSDNAPLVPTLDVIFSQTSTPLTPKQADFLAQANQQGGGDHDTPQRPRDTQGGIVPQPRAGLAPVPQQRQSAAMAIAARGRIARVEMHVAIAFGASVQPLTRITPKVSSTVISSAGLLVMRDMKSDSVMVISFPFPRYHAIFPKWSIP